MNLSLQQTPVTLSIPEALTCTEHSELISLFAYCVFWLFSIDERRWKEELPYAVLFVTVKPGFQRLACCPSVKSKRTLEYRSEITRAVTPGLFIRIKSTKTGTKGKENIYSLQIYQLMLVVSLMLEKDQTPSQSNSTIQHMAVDEGCLLPLTFTLNPSKSSLPTRYGPWRSLTFFRRANLSLM